MENLKSTWRNLWRNRRRTLISIASVLFAVFFALVMRSLQLGSYDLMYKNIIESYTGYIQVQEKDFWDDKTIEHLMHLDEETENTILSNPNVKMGIPRFESFALASSGPKSKGVMVMGIDPEKEKYLSNAEGKMVRYMLTPKAIEALKNENSIPEKIKEELDLFSGTAYTSFARLQLDFGIKDDEKGQLKNFFDHYASFDGEYIKRGENGVLVGSKAANYLNLDVGDTIILLGQGYHGTTAAGKYRINGFVKLPSPDIDSRIVYLPVDVCQELFNAPEMITSFALGLYNTDDGSINQCISELEDQLSDDFAILGWRKMNATMIQQMDADNKSGFIMILILYLVIAFGIFGTVLMMTAERKREFGVLVAIGMQKSKLRRIVSIEMVLLGLSGILGGMLLATPFVIYGYYHPIRFSGEIAKMYEDYGFEPLMAFKWINSY